MNLPNILSILDYCTDCSNNPFGRLCYPPVLNIGKQRSLSEGESKCKSLSEGKSNCNPIICFP